MAIITRYSINTALGVGKQVHEIDIAAKDDQSLFSYLSDTPSVIEYGLSKYRGAGPDVVNYVYSQDFGAAVRMACHILGRDWNGLTVRAGGKTFPPEAIAVSRFSIDGYRRWIEANCAGRFLYIQGHWRGLRKELIYLEDATDRLMFAVNFGGAAK